MEQCYAEFLCITRRIGLLGFVVRRHTQVQGISGSCGYRRLEIHFYFENLTNLIFPYGRGMSTAPLPNELFRHFLGKRELYIQYTFLETGSSEMR